MCDYSVEHLASRPAKVGDKLVTMHFKHTLTGGFCAVGEPNVAVCLKPGTELAFDHGDASRRSGIAGWSAHFRHPFVRGSIRDGHSVAHGGASTRGVGGQGH